MPFCQVRRLTTAKSGPEPAVRAKCCFEGALVGLAFLQALAVIGDSKGGIARRIPDIAIDAVDDPPQDAGAVADHAFQSHAEFRRLDFACIARADGGDGIGAGQPCLEKAHPAIIFRAVDGIGPRRQPQLGKDALLEASLKGDIVHGQDAGSRPAWPRRIAQISRRKTGLPVMRMQEIEGQPGDGARSKVRTGPTQSSKAAPIVLPFRTLGIAVRTAGARKQVRSVQDQKWMTVDLRSEQTGRMPQQVGILVHNLRLLRPGQHAGITRKQSGDDHAMRRERGRQSPDHVGQAAGLDQRIGLRRDGQDLHHDRRSIISGVIRQMPLWVR